MPFDDVKAPHGKTINDLLRFCKSHSELYIYGVCKASSDILEYLRLVKVDVKGYVVSDERIGGYSVLTADGIAIFALSEISVSPQTGIILGLPEIYYNDAIDNLKQRGFLDFFLLREHDKLGICDRLQSRTPDTFPLQFQIADHCNLGCRMCCNFSQIAEESFMSIESFRQDLLRLRELIGKESSGSVEFSGGEPLLHPQVSDFISVAHDIFPMSPIYLYTNGIKLLSMSDSFWETLHLCGVTVLLTIYPINLDLNAIITKSDLHQVAIFASAILEDTSLTSDYKSIKYQLDLSGTQSLGNFILCCNFNLCISVRDGKLYACNFIQNVHIFNEYFGENLEVCEEDYLDIYRARDFDELARFVKKPPAFCRYCDVMNRRRVGGWALSKKSIDEYID